MLNKNRIFNKQNLKFTLRIALPMLLSGTSLFLFESYIRESIEASCQYKTRTSLAPHAPYPHAIFQNLYDNCLNLRVTQNCLMMITSISALSSFTVRFSNFCIAKFFEIDGFLYDSYYETYSYAALGAFISCNYVEDFGVSEIISEIFSSIFN